MRKSRLGRVVGGAPEATNDEFAVVVSDEADSKDSSSVEVVEKGDSKEGVKAIMA